MREIFASILVVLLAIAIALFICTVINCQSNGIQSGEIYKLEHTMPYSDIVYIPLITSNGKTSTTTLFPYLVHHPEEWIVYIKAFNENKNDFEYNHFYLNEDVYRNLKVGDMFEFDKSTGFSEEPVTKEKK